MFSNRGDRLSLVRAAIALLWGCAKQELEFSTLITKSDRTERIFDVSIFGIGDRHLRSLHSVTQAIVNQKALCRFNSFTRMCSKVSGILQKI
ncbi:hypothetical protein PI95_025660 [Hassallia byssoidea VB512170]|uniref:Uncharacterized protein n=1 Tax=Hassallia byssoidea VB512170 TaxID=1304833 RepID=A0A846HHE6_9CYAN|nr:hypothetical protein [Hassalia byssoidea]NEU75851.1 hypothetical protein [Hassalia byssoidea VB512170]